MRILSKFLRNRRGNVAIIFGISAVPMFVCVGAAVDYVRSSTAKATLQTAVDAAALSAGSSGINSGSKILAAASEYLRANGNDNLITAIKDVDVKKINGDTLRITARAELPATVLRVVGFNTFDVTAVTDVTRGGGNVELALALDTTGSMEGAKLTALKDAAHSLTTELINPSDPQNQVRMSIVPFAEYVNVGESYRHEDWIDVPDDYTATENVCTWSQPNKSNCKPSTCSYVSDGKTVEYACQKCDGEWKQTCSPQSVSYRWHGCVGSRDYPLDTRDTDPSTEYPGLMNVWCASPVTRLTHDKSKLDQAIDKLSASGNTYIPAGLMWAWNTLSNEKPFDDGVSYGNAKAKNISKVLVLMTDGANTLSPNYPWHTGADTAQANKLVAELCTNIKAVGITIYTISFEVADSTAEDMLKSCATSPAHYFDANSTTELKTAFTEIGQRVGQLRLAR